MARSKSGNVTSTSQRGGSKNAPHTSSSAKRGGKRDGKMNGKGDQITEADTIRVMDLLFDKSKILYKHQIESYDKFIEEDIPKILAEDLVFSEKVTKDKIYRNYFKARNPAFVPPTLEQENEPMFPQDARINNLSYNGKVLAHIEQWLDIRDIATGKVARRKIGEEPAAMNIGNTPMIVGGKFCSTNLHRSSEKMKEECRYDSGGYFIINGNEKVLMSCETMAKNKPNVFLKKEQGVQVHVVHINSCDLEANDGVVQTLSIALKKNSEMTIRMPKFNEFSVFTLFRALGIESDKEIVELIVHDTTDFDMVNVVVMALEKSRAGGKERIFNKVDAYNSLATKLHVNKRYSDTDKNVKNEQKRLYLKKLVEKDFLPHIKGSSTRKAYFLGNMINKLIRVELGRLQADDRDSFKSKRIEPSGVLAEQKFRESIKKMLNECNKSFKSRNNDDENPALVVDVIRPTAVEQGLRQALTTGTWSKNKKGISQVLMRLAYLQQISYLRRIVTPSADASTNKLTSPRHVHNTQAFFACPIESPEGHKIGLVKNLALSASITNMMLSQLPIIRGIIEEMGGVKPPEDCRPIELTKYTKVMVNGEWIGMYKRAKELSQAIEAARTNSKLDYNVTAVHDRMQREINIYCDGGRLIRPLFRVGEDNQLLLKKEHVDAIARNIKERNEGKIATWNEFMLRFPGVIDYIDIESSDHAMVAMYPNDVYKERKAMQVYDFDAADRRAVKINRYDKYVWKRYTHCEMHPILMMGLVSANTPFSNHNQAPRNVFQYAYARQAIGIYASNWRKRLDISYVLYHPQRSLVTTCAMKWIGTDKLPAGENIVVAIMGRKGYNQEDSIEICEDATDRGLMACISLKKYINELKKNASVSRDDEFMKPQSSDVADMGDFNYNKLNMSGYIPEGTEIVNNDAIIGKGTPIADRENESRRFRDSSDIFKTNVPGAIDKVWPNLTNQEGYKMLKVRVRMERVPTVGDKYGSRHGQKGTCGLLQRARNMPYIEKTGTVVDFIINPNAIPSRMTIGQLNECQVGKAGALEGRIYDGTPFSNVDMDEVKALIKKNGFSSNGHEIMRDGVTGKRYAVEIFVGPTFQQRLKHLVADKIHARAQGPKQVLTRQPPFISGISSTKIRAEQAAVGA
jgi:DNA-directed RNA polymerase II subunit RPB2